DDTCFSIDVIDKILEEDFDALLNEGSEILHSIEGTILEEKLFAEFDEFMAMTTDKNFESESDIEEPPFKKITFNTNYKIKTSLEEPPMDLELKPLLDNLEYVFLEEPSFLPVIISSQLFEENKNKLVFVLKIHKQAFAWKTTNIPGILPVFMDDFFVFGSSFDHSLNNLDKMLQCCKDAHIRRNLRSKRRFGNSFDYSALHKQKLSRIARKSIQSLEKELIVFEYILVVVDYVSKLTEAQALPTNDARVVITCLKKLFCYFGMPKALISDRGTHFCNKIMEKTKKIYGVNHRFSTSYHPQTSGQVQNANRALKRILEKTVKDNPTIWSRKLDDALWAFRTTYKTPTEITLYKLIYGKNFLLPFEIKHRVYWARKNCNPDLIPTSEKRMFQLHELDELRHQAYENSRLYKARTKV
ncbi:reverse transcriptase domain-containing protein, partial [Tanacetum coccineum]